MKIEHIFGSPGKICAILRRFCGNIPFFRAKLLLTLRAALFIIVA